jgi:SHS2 domain-containing protein
MPAPPECAAPEYFEHGADIGVVGRGATVEAALESAAAAMFAIMVEPAAVQPLQSVAVEFDEDDVEFALVRWLNALLAAARERGLALCRFQLARRENRWQGTARGEPWRDGHARGTEVKGATLTALSVRQDEHGWQARCVVDV